MSKIEDREKEKREVYSRVFKDMQNLLVEWDKDDLDCYFVIYSTLCFAIESSMIAGQEEALSCIGLAMHRAVQEYKKKAENPK